MTFLFRIGLGTLLSGAHLISEGMLQAAAEWYDYEQKDIFTLYLHFSFLRQQQH